jgi:hypothetical protein
MTSATETPDPIASPSDLDRALAVHSYNALSHVPQQRADTDIRFYVEAVAALNRKLAGLAKTPEQQALIPPQIEHYKANYRQHQHAIWAAQIDKHRISSGTPTYYMLNTNKPAACRTA